MLSTHFKLKLLIIAERSTANTMQGVGESMVDYITELQRLSTKCEFGEFLNDTLRDRFMCGLWSEATR